MKSAVAVAVLALVGSTIAQESSYAQRIADVIAQLEDEDQHDSAFHRLVAMGEPAVHVIRAQIEKGEYSAARFRILGKIGPAAVDTFPLLFESIPDCPPELVPSLYHALLSLWAFLPDEHVETIERLRNDLGTSISAAEDEGTRRELAAVMSRCLNLTMPPLIHESSSMDVLVEALGERRGTNTHRTQLAAQLLGRMGAKARPVLPDLLQKMKRPVHRGTGSMTYRGGRVTNFNPNPMSNKPYAEAILCIDPTGVEAVEAHIHLIEHGDSQERMEAVRALGVLGEPGVRGIAYLVRIARDPEERDAMRYEAITTMGMIGPIGASSSIPTLEALSEHEDPQIAERAKAALRQIRGQPPKAQDKPDERRIAELIDQLRGDIPDGWEEEFVTLCRMSRPNSRLAIDGLARVVPETPSTNLAVLLRATGDLSPYYGEGVFDKVVEAILHPIEGSLRPMGGRDRQDVLTEILRTRELLFLDGLGSIEALAKNLKHQNPHVREEAAKLLGARNVEALPALPDLQLALTSEHPPMEELADYIIGPTGRLRIVNTRSVSHDSAVHANVARAMTRIAPADPSIRSAYVFLLSRGNAEERLAAATALAHLGPDPAALAGLMAALTDKDPVLVREAITAIGMMGSGAKDAIPVLEGFSEDDDPQIAERAKAALRQIRGPRDA